jgi:hypothetical protein
MNRRKFVVSLFCTAFLVSSCSKQDGQLNIAGRIEKKPAPAMVLPEKFVKEWQEFRLEKSILFDVCKPKTIRFEQGGTEFFWLILGGKSGEQTHRIHRISESDGNLLVYSTPRGSLAGTDTSLLVLEPVHTVAGVMRARQFGRASDYPKEDGNLYFVGDLEVVSPNPPLEKCDDEK